MIHPHHLPAMAQADPGPAGDGLADLEDALAAAGSFPAEMKHEERTMDAPPEGVAYDMAIVTPAASAGYMRRVRRDLERAGFVTDLFESHALKGNEAVLFLKLGVPAPRLFEFAAACGAPARLGVPWPRRCSRDLAWETDETSSPSRSVGAAPPGPAPGGVRGPGSAHRLREAARGGRRVARGAHHRGGPLPALRPHLRGAPRGQAPALHELRHAQPPQGHDAHAHGVAGPRGPGRRAAPRARRGPQPARRGVPFSARRPDFRPTLAGASWTR